MVYDAIIIGGSFSGMAAALQLARARRKVLVLDAGQPRNRFAAHSHGVLAQDGRAGSDILLDAAAQLKAYPTAQIYRCNATAVSREGGELVVEVDGGARWFTGRRVLLATGVRDELPPIPGLRERWGVTVMHCPYCHGYELDAGAIGVLGVSPLSVHQALLVSDWGDVTFFTDGKLNPDANERDMLARRKVKIEPMGVAAIEGDGGDALDVRLLDGRRVTLRGLFVGSRVEVASTLAEGLGCDIEETPQGHIIKTGPDKQTAVPGVYAAGDTGQMMQSITMAMSDGVFAGINMHRSLIWEEAHGEYVAA